MIYPTQEELSAIDEAAEQAADNSDPTPGEFHPGWHDIYAMEFARRIIEWHKKKLVEQEPVGKRRMGADQDRKGYRCINPPHGRRTGEEIMFEIFNDPAYYDMWCLRKADNKSFNHTLHFNKKEEAEHAQAVIERWQFQHDAEVIERCAKVCDDMPIVYERDGHYINTAPEDFAAAIRDLVRQDRRERTIRLGEALGEVFVKMGEAQEKKHDL